MSGNKQKQSQKKMLKEIPKQQPLYPLVLHVFPRGLDKRTLLSKYMHIFEDIGALRTDCTDKEIWCFMKIMQLSEEEMHRRLWHPQKILCCRFFTVQQTQVSQPHNEAFPPTLRNSLLFSA